MIEPDNDDILYGLGVPRLPMVRLNMQEPLNIDPSTQLHGCRPSHWYVVMGEVNDSGHYLLLNLNTGKFMPGCIDMERFELVPKDTV